VLTALGAILISASMIHLAGEFITLGEQLLLLSGCILLSSTIVLIPYAMEDPTKLSHQLLLILCTGICTLLIIAWLTPLSLLSPILWRITVGLCLLIVTLTAVAGLLTQLTDNHNSITLWITLLLLITAGTPIWLGPAVELFYLEQSTINAIITTSPLSYLAALADWDYLRGEWFYRHTPFGGLRFDYPSISITSLIYLTIGLACHYIRRIIATEKPVDNICIKHQSLSILGVMHK